MSIDSGDRPQRDYTNLLEPGGLIAHFLAHPPNGFHAAVSRQDVPVFATRFNLLTAADPRTQRVFASLPLYRWWRRLLNPLTCFVGTTVSEYALFPPADKSAAITADTLVDQLMDDYSGCYPFLIVKDMPHESPLLDATANAYAQRVAAACAHAGFLMLEGQALAYVPIDFNSTDDYLARLSGGRRKDIRRKLRAAAALHVETVPTGDARFADAAVRAEFYALYLNVYNQSELQFDLLSPAFFDAVLRDGTSDGIVFIYRHEGRMIGFNLCYVARGNLVDKTVGFAYPQAREQSLYFVSWMHNLEYARARGLRHYIAGWTDPEIKAYLGAKFTFTRHAVYVRNRFLRALVRFFAPRFERDRAWQETNTNAPSHRRP